MFASQKIIMGDKKHHKNYVSSIIILYEDNGLTCNENAAKLNLSLKFVEKVVNDNCHYGE